MPSPRSRALERLAGLLGPVRRRRAAQQDAARVRQTGLFDEHWYRSQYDVGSRDAALDYVRAGARGGRDPNPLFQSGFYLHAYPDVFNAGANPLLHYCDFGVAEGRDPNPMFDTQWYLAQNPDVVAGTNPLSHYISAGSAQGRRPSPLFDTSWYCDRNHDIAIGLDPLAHYLRRGAAEGRPPSASFDVDWPPESPTDRPAVKSNSGECTLAAVQGAIQTAAKQSSSPFYPLLALIAARCGAPMLREIVRTLDAIDLPRLHRVAPKGPLVSVVMPVYNRRDLVRGAIDSVLAQSYPAFELLVCDDASSDDTVAVVESCFDPRIRLIRQSRNSGAAAARNRCLDIASGRYVAYLDSDNVWHPHFLAVMLDALQAEPGAPFGYASYFDAVEQAGGYYLRPTRYRGFDYDLQIANPYLDLNSLVHERALFERYGGFDESLRRLQDCDLIARYAMVHEPRHVPFALNIYRRLQGVAQITSLHEGETVSKALIEQKIKRYREQGMPGPMPGPAAKPQ